MTKDNMFFPEVCPHCGHSNHKNKWCYETISDTGVIYGFCNRQAEPAVGWKATKDTDKNGVVKYVYTDSLTTKQSYTGKEKTTFYTYRKEGKPILRVKRVDSKTGKTITQQKFEGDRWVSGGLPPESVPLYRYDELDFSRAIFVVEGEKVADKLWELGLQATTNLGGAKKWRPEHSQSLQKAKKIVICPDQDKVGIAHAEEIYKAFPSAHWLYAYPNSPYWRLNVPENKGVDLFDYICANNLKKEDLIKEVKSGPIHKIVTDAFVKTPSPSPLSELVSFIRDKLTTLGDLEQADLIEISQKTQIPYNLVNSLYNSELNKLSVVETLPDSSISKLFEYQSKQVCLSDLISDEALCLNFKAYCEVTRIDEVLLVMSLLPLVGAELGSRLKIAPKPTWFEYPCFWTVTVAPPSSKKSVVQNHIYRVVKKRDAKNEAKAQANSEALKKLQRAWERLSQSQREANSENPEVNPDLYEEQFCKPPRLSILQSCSSESLWKRISEQPVSAGVVWCWDEIAGLLEGLDKYSKGSDTRPLLLSAWSSHLEFLSVQRVDRANSFRLGEQTLSITGNIQPDLFSKYFKLNGDKDGFASRWLYAIPKKHPKFAKYTDRSVDLQPVFEDLFAKLEQLPPTTVVFSPSAHKYWTQVWERYHLEIERTLYSNPVFSQYIAKMLSYVLRLALVIHILDVVSGVASDLRICSKSALERAVKLSSYFLGQFRLLQIASCEGDSKFQRLESFNLDKILLDIICFLQQEAKDKTASTRDITRKFSGRKVNGVRLNSEIVAELLQHLADLSFGYFSEDKKEFTLTEPSIQAINQATKSDEPLQPLTPKFNPGDVVCILGGRFDGYLVHVDAATPLTITFTDPLSGRVETISNDYCELYTEEIGRECIYICEKLRKVTSKEELLKVVYSHPRYFKVALTAVLEEEARLTVEKFL